MHPLDVIVVGAGIAGIASARALAAAGLRVCVLEQHSTVAQEASFGDGGLLLPSPLDMAFGPAAWPDAASSARGWPWSRERRDAERAQRFATGCARLRPLIDRSKEELKALEASRSIPFEAREQMLYVFDSPADFERGMQLSALLDAHNDPHQVLDGNACLEFEPSLNKERPLAGGILHTAQRTGNCALLAKRLKPVLESSGVQFAQGRATHLRVESNGVAIEITAPAPAVTAPISFNADVAHGRDRRTHSPSSSKATRAAPGTETLTARTVVIAAGTGSPALLASAGVKLRLGTMMLHTLTAPIAHEEFAPQRAIFDIGSGVGMVRFDNRLRIFRTTPLASAPKKQQRAFDSLGRVAYDRLPGVARLSHARAWEGRRLLAPDRLPVFGATPHPRVLVNLAHGASGWALAFGCAQALADTITGRTPDLDADTLAACSPTRLKGI